MAKLMPIAVPSDSSSFPLRGTRTWSDAGVKILDVFAGRAMGKRKWKNEDVQGDNQRSKSTQCQCERPTHRAAFSRFHAEIIAQPSQHDASKSAILASSLLDRQGRRRFESIRKAETATVTNGKSPAKKGQRRRAVSMIRIKNRVRAQKVPPITLGLVRLLIEQNPDISTKNNFSRSYSFPIIERRKDIYILERGSNVELWLEIIARNPCERYD
jgi:hypothetical protein